jgi:hypothetical protein
MCREGKTSCMGRYACRSSCSRPASGSQGALQGNATRGRGSGRGPCTWAWDVPVNLKTDSVEMKCLLTDKPAFFLFAAVTSREGRAGAFGRWQLDVATVAERVQGLDGRQQAGLLPRIDGCISIATGPAQRVHRLSERSRRHILGKWLRRASLCVLFLVYLPPLCLVFGGRTLRASFVRDAVVTLIIFGRLLRTSR